MTNQSKKFQKKVEDFVCEKCGNTVKGTGYTNHCPKCLWSKHVDINPGDREERCCGMMSPIKIETEGGEFVITHKCIKCGLEKRKRIEKTDDFDEVINVSKKSQNI